MVKQFLIIFLFIANSISVFGQENLLDEFHSLYEKGEKEKANQLLEALKNENIAYYFHALGTKNYYEGKYEIAKNKYRKASENYEKANDLLSLSDVKNNYAICCYFQDSLYKAYQIHLEVKTIREKKNSKKIGSTYNNLGLVLMGLKRDREAIVYYKKAVVYKVLNQDSAATSNSFNNIGLAYKHLQQYDSSLHYFQKALSIATEYKQLKMKNNVLNNLSGLYIQTNQTDSAQVYIYKALKSKKYFGNAKSQTRSLLNLAKVLNTKKQRSLAYSIVDSLSQVFRKNEGANLYELHLIYSFLYKMDSLNANYKSALENNLKKNYYNDALLHSHQALAIDSLNKRLELSKKNEQILSLEQQKYKDQEQLKLERNRLVYLSIIFILAVVVLFVVLWVLRKNIQQKRKIKTINNEVLQNNKLLQQILSVLSHDLKNSVYGNLEVIQLMRRKIDSLDPEKVTLLISQIEDDAITTRKTLDEIISWLIAAYNYKKETEKISLQKALLELEQEFTIKFQERNINIKNQLKATNIMASKPLVKSIFRNVFTNILSYSKEETTVVIEGTNSKIKIVELNQTWSENELELLNNKNEHFSSLGVLIIHSITHLINAEVVYLNTKDGATIVFNFESDNG